MVDTPCFFQDEECIFLKYRTYYVKDLSSFIYQESTNQGRFAPAMPGKPNAQYTAEYDGYYMFRISNNGHADAQYMGISVSAHIPKPEGGGTIDCNLYTFFNYDTSSNKGANSIYSSPWFYIPAGTVLDFTGYVAWGGKLDAICYHK